MAGASSPELLSVLTSAQVAGFIGPGPLEPHVERSLEMAALIPPVAGRILDLGSGGGLPGLPLSLVLPDSDLVLLDGSLTRCRFLRDAVDRLSLNDRVQVVAARAEEAGHGPLRAAFDVVVSRSFGAPAVVSECAAPFLKPGGWLVVAEPPAHLGEGSDRWPAPQLAELGLVTVQRVEQPSAFVVLEQVSLCPDRYPRRNGVPAKRPLF